ncbi:MAG: hypothetical protein PUG38_08825 [Sutterellaceae bacterium]|nr:hypothetical protein [Sutterellaceae bacterium]MDY2868503.1 hypothetical protein [Mesosutterella sp.]
MLGLLKTILGTRGIVRAPFGEPVSEGGFSEPETAKAVQPDEALRNAKARKHHPLGVPLDDIALPFAATQGLGAGFSGDILVLTNDHFRTTVRAVPASGPEGAAAGIEVRTNMDELVRRLHEAHPNALLDSWALGTLNAYAATGAMVEEDGHFYVVSRLGFTPDTRDWTDVVLPLASEAARFSAETVIGSITGDRLPEAYSIDGSAWGRPDFERLASEVPEGASARFLKDGLVVSVPLGARSGPGHAILDRIAPDAATVALTSGTPNPYLGAGLLVKLDLPVRFASEKLLREAAARLNLLELRGESSAHHFGAWMTKNGRTLSYTSFVVNSLKGNGSIDRSLLLGAVRRARWADGILKGTVARA